MLKSQRNSLLRYEGIRSFILREGTPSDLENLSKGIHRGECNALDPGQRSGRQAPALHSVEVYSQQSSVGVYPRQSSVEVYSQQSSVEVCPQRKWAA